METGSEHEICQSVELEALVSHMRRVRRQGELGCGARLGLVTSAREQGLMDWKMAWVRTIQALATFIEQTAQGLQ